MKVSFVKQRPDRTVERTQSSGRCKLFVAASSYKETIVRPMRSAILLGQDVVGP